jgi:hypothetical protein
MITHRKAANHFALPIMAIFRWETSKKLEKETVTDRGAYLFLEESSNDGDSELFSLKAIVNFTVSPFEFFLNIFSKNLNYL